MATHDSDGRDDVQDGPILLVDGDPHLRDALATILEQEGHRVLQAGDAPTALRMAREHHPDLLVLDSAQLDPGPRPPRASAGIDGEQVLGALRDELDDLPPALLLSAAAGSLARARHMGEVVGIEKPFNVPELLDAVARHRRRVKREAS